MFYKIAMLRDFGLHAKWILRYRRSIFRFCISLKWAEWKRSNQSQNSSIYDVHSQFARRMDCTFDKKNTTPEFYVTLNRSNDQRWLFPFEFRKREKIISMQRTESNCMLAASEINVRFTFTYRKFNRNFSSEPEISGINEIAWQKCACHGPPLRQHWAWDKINNSRRGKKTLKSKQAQVRLRWGKYLTISIYNGGRYVCSEVSVYVWTGSEGRRKKIVMETNINVTLASKPLD